MAQFDACWFNNQPGHGLDDFIRFGLVCDVPLYKLTVFGLLSGKLISSSVSTYCLTSVFFSMTYKCIFFFFFSFLLFFCSFSLSLSVFLSSNCSTLLPFHLLLLVCIVTTFSCQLDSLPPFLLLVCATSSSSSSLFAYLLNSFVTISFFTFSSLSSCPFLSLFQFSLLP